MYQLKLLLGRNLKHLIRDPSQLRLIFGVAIFNAILFGIVFLRLPRTQPGVVSRMGVIFLILIGSLAGEFNSNMLKIPRQIKVFHRENASNMYSSFAHIVAQLFVHIPVKFASYGTFL
eukprot:845160_1